MIYLLDLSATVKLRQIAQVPSILIQRLGLFFWWGWCMDFAE
jgi:hypothetical protein